MTAWKKVRAFDNEQLLSILWKEKRWSCLTNVSSNSIRMSHLLFYTLINFQYHQWNIQRMIVSDLSPSSIKVNRQTKVIQTMNGILHVCQHLWHRRLDLIKSEEGDQIWISTTDRNHRKSKLIFNDHCRRNLCNDQSLIF